MKRCRVTLLEGIRTMYRANDAHLPSHPVQGMLDALPDAAVALDAGTQAIRGANQHAVDLLSSASGRAHGGAIRDWFALSSVAGLVDAVSRAQAGGGGWVEVKIAGRVSRAYVSSMAIGGDKLVLVVFRPPPVSRGIASVALVREILAQLPIGVLLAEPGAPDVVLLNAACAEMCGIAIADRHQFITADRTWQVRDLNGETLTRDQLPTVRALLRAERSGPEDLVLVPAEGGSQHTVSTISTPVFDERGEVIAAVTTLVDVTQRREAEHALQAAREQAEVDARRKGAFYAALSREIRGPLTSILGYVELIGDPDTPAADRASWCNTVRRSGDALMALMQDLVDLGQMDAGSFRLSPGATQLSLVLGEVQSVARTRGQRRGIDVAMRYTTPVPRVVQWDAARLRRALLTMMTFAIDHADHGDVALQVAVIGAGASRKVAFDVSAWCRTVTAEDSMALLDPYTASKGGARAWSLAIPVASRLAEMMGGSFECKADGQRLRMRFTASAPPGAFEDTVSMHPASIDARPVSSRPPPRLHGRVLLVEDSEDDRMLVTRMLERSGLRVDAVATAAEALEVAMDQIDAVLMDVELPGMDGLEATRRLRERGVAVPVVALTAAALAGDRERCLAAGCTAYVSKPIDRPTLLRTLDDLVSTTEDRRIMSELPEELKALEPLRSTKEADASMRDALAQFGERAARYVDHIARNIEAGDHAGAERAARSLGGTAGSYGFEPLGRAADQLADACRSAEARPGEVMACLRAVSDLAQRVRATYPGRTTTVPPTSR